jgi:hypothetical protein
MNSIIQQISEEFIQAEMQLKVEQGLTAYLESSMENFKRYLLRMLPERIKELDDNIAQYRNIRPNWQVVRKADKRELVTAYGVLRYERRYYRNKRTGDYAYLSDQLLGVEAYERVELGLSSQLCQLATERSYAKSSEQACDGAVSRQTVMKKTRQVEEKPLEPETIRDDVSVLHIQADEDHVSMQDGRRDSVVKLAAIHEPLRRHKKRAYLPQRYCLSSYQEKTDDFWLRIATEIDKRYANAEQLKIYIHGDGASWIKTGLQWLPNSRFVLDKFHVKQYMRPVAGGDQAYMDLMWDCLNQDDYKTLKELVKAFIDQETCSAEKGEKFLRYVKNNWHGIAIWSDDQESAGGSCAEGLVSHILSDRLSSRPKAWLDEGLETVSRLRVYRSNGGQIKPDDLRKTYDKAVINREKVTKMMAKTASKFAPLPTSVFKTDKRTTSLHRLYDAIKDGGMVI